MKNIMIILGFLTIASFSMVNAYYLKPKPKAQVTSNADLSSHQTQRQNG